MRAMNTRGIAAWVCVVWVATGGAPSYGAAESAVPSEETGSQLEVIVVTANRREENSQRVPISITAISAEQLVKNGVSDPFALADFVPGLTFTRLSASSIPFLRGVGSPVGQQGAEPSVAYYVDDVYLPSGSASLANFNNVAGIEVAKGPQGTLFGRNATGGVIQVSTKNPTAAPELDLQGGVGNYGTYSQSIYATGAIAPQLSANIAAYRSNQTQGWGRDGTTGTPSFTGFDYGGRVKLLWTPADGTTVLLTGFYDKTISGLSAFRPFNGLVGAGGVYATPPAYYDIVDHSNPNGGSVVNGGSVKITQNLGWANLVSVSAYGYAEQIENFEETGAPFPILQVNNSGPEATWTQELRLVSTDNAAPLNWIAGVYYMNDDAQYSPLKFSGPAFAPLPYASLYATQITNSYSGFAQSTLQVLPGTHLTAGLRYTSDQREAKVHFDDGGFVSAAPNSPESQTFDKLTERLSLDHQFTDDIMAYVAFNRGFKSGLFNLVVLPVPGDPIAPAVLPETLDSYTIGTKTEFLNHHLRLNVEGFFYNYKNIQSEREIAGATEIVNAAKATIKGVDIDITAVPIEHLTLSTSLELMDGKYGSGSVGVLNTYHSRYPAPFCGLGAAGALDGNCTSSTSIAGNKTIFTPPFSLSVTADYAYPTKIGLWDFNVAWNHGGDYYADLDNGKGQISPDYDKQGILNLFNASVGWESTNSRWDARLWAKNITGVKYWAWATETSFNTQYTPASPSTFGLTVGLHFK